ncbi:type VI secretion system-associated protein TagF [Azohydromonas caseinilytica]|uniref:Type VI secretion system-associated protein TagF n=1 Tax=Azohydromonas caseinilytica TaxID=2728836 RepID=A0A848F690_9BURK|nr:type VI secretion system-associated protein TagF [Azohydromonas caseinilytica]NML13621.1 type VI secretion system-associated protein TagF [Azohydromonas caseinilytica]
MSETPVTETPATENLAGWYGKLPHLGDFASRRLPGSFIAGWDEWLRHGLASAREALGPRWLDGYLVAPIVRFWVAPGLLGASSWAGLLMPSVDRVGRHFPLTVAQPGPTLAQAQAAPGWFDALDAAARRVLDLDFTVDDFERALAEAVQGRALPWLESAPAQPEGETGSVWWFSQDGAELRGRFEKLPPAAAFTRFLEACR